LLDISDANAGNSVNLKGHQQPEAAMKKILVFASLFLATSLAFAHNCPNEMKAIDAKLNSGTSLSAEDMTKVKQLRAEGEKYHKEGKHDESMKSLQEAKKMLGI
jgi:hypothetical protein